MRHITDPPEWIIAWLKENDPSASMYKIDQSKGYYYLYALDEATKKPRYIGTLKEIEGFIPKKPRNRSSSAKPDENLPDWIRIWLMENDSDSRYRVVCKKGSYYLYEHGRDGKKPEYIGRLRESTGLIYKRECNNPAITESFPELPVRDIQIFEYGFSKALLALVPDKWKAGLKEDWLPILLSYIEELSPTSYLLEITPKKETGQPHYAGMHRMKLNKLLQVNISELFEKLHTILLVKENNEVFIANCKPEQIAFLKSLNIKLEEISWPEKEIPFTRMKDFLTS